MSHSHDGKFSDSLEVSLNSPAFLRLLRSELGWCGPDADDVMGETLLRLWKLNMHGRFESKRGTPLQFALGVARYIRLELQRRRRELPLNGESVEEVDDRDPSEPRVCQERSTAVTKLIQTLAPEDQELIAQRFYVPREERRPMTNRQCIRLCRLLKWLRRELATFKQE